MNRIKLLKVSQLIKAKFLMSVIINATLVKLITFFQITNQFWFVLPIYWIGGKMCLNIAIYLVMAVFGWTTESIQWNMLWPNCLVRGILIEKMSLHPFSDENNFLCSERKFRAMYTWQCCRLIKFEKYMHDSAAACRFIYFF